MDKTILNGELGFSDLIGVKTFNGITVNASGTWNNGTVSEAFFINGDIVNNGSWTGCPTGQNNCNYQFSSSAALSGSSFISMPDIVIDASVTVTNNGLLSVGDRITRSEDNKGSATFVNGTNAFLIFNGSNATSPDKFDLSTFTATAPGNFVGFGGTNQDIPVNSGSYNRITINGGDVGLDGDISIANRLTLTDGDINLGSNTLTIEAAATISGGSSTSYINASGSGVLRRGISATGTYSIPLGGASYSPISINLATATLGSNPYLDFGITDSAHPNRDTDNTAATPPGDDDGTAATDYLDVYWTVAANDITTPTYSISYIYDASDFTQSTESNMVGAFYRTLSGGSTRDWLANGILDTSTNTVSFSGLSSFGDFYAMDNTLNRLPVELVYFRAKNDQSRVLVQWATASEENNDYFTLERSRNAREYEVLGYVAGYGSSQNLRHYQFTDPNPLSGRSFYRLKQTDFNGSFSYSELIPVEVESSQTIGAFKVYPNPVLRGEKIYVRPAIKSPAQWRLVSPSGHALGPGYAGLLNTNQTIEVSGAWKPGLYLLELLTDSGRWLKRIVIR